MSESGIRLKWWGAGFALVLMGGLFIGLAVWRTPVDQGREPVRREAQISPGPGWTKPADEGWIIHEEVLPITEAESNAVQGDDVLLAWAESLKTADIPVELHGLQLQHQTEDLKEVIVLLAKRWAEVDLGAALEWAESIPADETRQALFNALAIEWASQDPEGAIEWVNQWPVGTEKQNGLLAVSFEAARMIPELALGCAMDQPVLPEWDELIRYAAMQWAASSPERALVWTDQHIHEPLRGQVLSGVATAWGETDPVNAANLALEWITPGRMQDDAVIGIVQRWVQKDPEKTAAWVDAFPEGTLKQTAQENVAKLWADINPQQAATWAKDAQ